MAGGKVMQKAHNDHARAPAPAPLIKKRAREADATSAPAPTPPLAVPYEGSKATGFRLEPHICRVCHSRIGSHAGGTDGRRVYECTNCGLSAQGHSAACMCCCGIKLRKGGRSGRPGLAEVDAGIRCIANPAPTPEFPSIYVAGYVPPTPLTN
jgi:hypothetical protein